jgi:hypothetical protein
VRTLNDPLTQTQTHSNDAPHSTQSNEVLKSAGTNSLSAEGAGGGSAWAAGLVPGDRDSDSEDKEEKEMHKNQGQILSPSNNAGQSVSASASRQGTGTGTGAPAGLRDKGIGIDETSEVEDGDGGIIHKGTVVSSAGAAVGVAAVTTSSSASSSPSSPAHYDN